MIKSGGWQWQRARTTDPDRVDRLWVAVSVATLWLVEVGGLAEFDPRAETVPPLGRSGGPRVHRLFRVGSAVILAGLLNGQVWSGRFVPEPWPVPVPIPTTTEELFRSQPTYTRKGSPPHPCREARPTSPQSKHWGRGGNPNRSLANCG